MGALKMSKKIWITSLFSVVCLVSLAFAQGVDNITSNYFFQTGTTATFESGSTLAVASGATFTNAGTYTATGAVNQSSKLDILSGGEIEISSGATLDIVAGATMTSAATNTVTGAVNQSSKLDILTGGGEVEISSGGVLDIVAGATVTNAADMTNSGINTQTGAVNQSSKLDILTGGGEVEISSGAIFEIVSGATWTVADGTIPRDDLTEDALARSIGITPLMWQHNTTGAALTVAETAGTHDLAQVYITGEVADNETEISESQVFFYLPDNYVAGGDVSVTFRSLRLGGEDGGAASRIDCELSEMADGVAVGDQIGTAAQVLTATPTTFTFTVTDESAYVAGDLIRLLLITTAVDDAGGTTMTAVIADTKILCDVKG